MVLQEPSAIAGKTVTDFAKPSNSLTVMGYIRADVPQDYYFFLKEKNLLRNGSKFLFYFYAIKGNNVYSHHKDVFKATDFRFYKNQISKTNSYQLEPVRCRIISNELISCSELVKRLQELGYSTSEEKHHADFYYVLTVEVIDDVCPPVEYKIAEVNSQNGNDTFSPHSPKVLMF